MFIFWLLKIDWRWAMRTQSAITIPTQDSWSHGSNRILCLLFDCKVRILALETPNGIYWIKFEFSVYFLIAKSRLAIDRVVSTRLLHWNVEIEFCAYFSIWKFEICCFKSIDCGEHNRTTMHRDWQKIWITTNIFLYSSFSLKRRTPFVFAIFVIWRVEYVNWASTCMKYRKLF